MAKIIIKLLAIANLLIIAGLLMTGYSGTINPAHHPYVSIIGFAFPAFLIANALCIVGWLFVRKKLVLLPLAGMLLAFQPISIYFPLNIFKDDTSSARTLKILSFNVLGFNKQEAPKGVPNPIMQYLIDSDADIICIQEYAKLHGQDSLTAVFRDTYQYLDTIHSDGYKKGDDVVAVCSRYPIIGKQHIPIYTRGNSLGVFDLDINGDTVHIINAHLETVGMSYEQKAQFGNMVHGNTNRSALKADSKMVLHKLAASAAVRAPQADAINAYIEAHRGERIIFCGDINDHPLSYVHHTIAQNLTDCYPASATGPGYTYNYNSMYVRIDNIMCSDHYRPNSCTVDKSINLSDHYPISCCLRAKNGEE